MKRAFAGPLSLFASGLCLAVCLSVLNAARTQGLPIAPFAFACAGCAAALIAVTERRTSHGAWTLFAAVLGMTVFGWAVSEVGRANLGQLPGAVPALVLSFACATSLLAVRPSARALTVGGLLALTLAIAYFSGGKGGADPFFRWLVERGMDERTAEAVVVVARKSVHIGFYGSIALAARSVLRAVAAPARGDRWPAATFAWVAGFAVFDEARQALSAGRSSQVWDVLIDLAGAALFILVADRIPRRPRPD